MIQEQLLLYLARSLERCNSCKSTFIFSSQVLLGLPHLLLPSNMMLSILLMEPSKVFLCTCSNHLNLFPRIFAKIVATLSFSLNSWFLILSINVWPHIHLSMRISITSILCSKFFFTGQHVVLYNKAGLIGTW